MVVTQSSDGLQYLIVYKKYAYIHIYIYKHTYMHKFIGPPQIFFLDVTLKQLI